MEQQHKRLEDALDAKSSALLRLRKAAVQQTECNNTHDTTLRDALQEWDAPQPQPESTNCFAEN